MAAIKSVTRGTLKEVQKAVHREVSYTKGIKKAIEKVEKLGGSVKLTKISKE